MELSRLIQHPEEMNRETLYDLRALLALYPYYQTARLLMLKNLYLLHDPSFDEELRRAAIYITDRKIIFEMVEAAHYQIKNAPEEAESNKQQGVRGIGAEKHGDRTSDLIDHFLGSIPMDAEEEELALVHDDDVVEQRLYIVHLMSRDDEGAVFRHVVGDDLTELALRWDVKTIQKKAINIQKNNLGITNIVSADQVGKFPDSNIGVH